MAITLRSDSELQLIDDILGSHYQNSQALEDFRMAATIQTEREAMMRIMREFDAFCGDNGIDYFIMAGTLKGAVAYEDFLPGAETIDLGMLRADYERFAELYRKREAADENGCAFSFWKLTGYGSNEDDKMAPSPVIKTRDSVPVMFEGSPVYATSSMAMRITPQIVVGIFDECPDDFFTRKKFFRQMKRRNDFFQRIVVARDLIFNRARKMESRPLMLKYYNWMKVSRAFRYFALPKWLLYADLHAKAKKYAGEGMQDVVCVLGTERSKTISRAEIGEYKRVRFCGMDVQAPENGLIWASDPILEASPELRRLQEDAKIIVEEINRLCDIIGVKYFACGGTMLGYVRHGGFIPWDDDIDVGMLREDYIKFLEEAPKHINTEEFFLQTRESDPNIPYLFSKIRLNNSEYITEYNKDRDFHKGICVDIFPFDFIPNEVSEQVSFRGGARKLARQHNYIVNRQYPDTATATTAKKKNLDWLIGQINGKLLAHHYWSKSLDVTQAAYDEYVQQLNATAEEEGLQFVASFVPTYTMVSLEDLLPYQKVDFEGISINVPKNPEVFLRMQYGDFMEMPYPHQRMGHDLLVWSDAGGIGGGRLIDEEMLAAQQ